jgi:hypothetical protein
MVWPTSCDGVAIGQGMVGRNCGQVNRNAISSFDSESEIDPANAENEPNGCLLRECSKAVHFQFKNPVGIIEWQGPFRSGIGWN